MKVKKTTLFLSLILTVLLVFLDQLTKSSIANQLSVYSRVEVIHNFFDLTYVKNTGAGFSILEGAGLPFFTILTIIAEAAILYIYCTTQDVRIQMSLTFVFAGALGNWIDRFRFGYVRDFFSFNLFGHAFPVFNVADICITCGFLAILIISLSDDIKEKRRWKSMSSE
ncbi:signal peptidase II [Catenisphaera adipataccumulans]|jgi:signal peptidase II|uniref:Lipoprotein signal peptidase n=1 Tax=Catenisphaera adipataccumulans TaxID=700500 RepID=A0A7W8CXU0_9FIRM|nr:signal peptidase II [Catenisphaera adipataccumulans]MBB5183600.1 signal peptidase II [Catenisphaera adipataccumulans]